MESGLASDEVQGLLDALADPLVACDRQERILYLNPAAERLLCWTQAELAGQPLTRLLPERLHVFQEQSFLRYLLGRQSVQGGRALRVPALLRSGAELEVEVTVGSAGQGEAERIVLTLRRAPELPACLDEPLEREPGAREPLEPSLDSRAERAWRLICENAPLGLFHFDTTPLITACNDYFVSIVGSSKRTLIGLKLFTLRDEALMACVREVLAGKRAFYEGDYQSVTADKVTPVRIHFAPCFNARGQVQGGVGIVEDVTEQRKVEQERNRLIREAEEAIRVRDDFLTIASHELKTPLTPLSLRLASLERRLERSEPVDPALLRHARQYLVQLTALINDLLDASRVESGRLSLHVEPTRLEALVEHALSVQDRERHGHRIDYMHPTHPVNIRADAYRLEQVISNLLENALKYSPRDSTVRVTLEVHGDFALLSVSDEGIGIPRDQQAHLFERYFRARNASPQSYGGLGLGLYISRDIVERHGGRIWVESEVGRGSTFHVALPLLEAASPEPPTLHH
jgi:PAS domain S-box-containing protein